MKSPQHNPRVLNMSAGFTLVELMIAMVLGLLVIGSVISALLANKQNYRTNEGLSQVQESTRTAFEILARDIRQSGANGCDNTGRVSNLLDPDGLWWQDWFGMLGYDAAENDPAVAFGADEADRVAGTDSIQLQSIGGNGFSIETHDPVAATLKVNSAATDIVAGDVLIVCDFDHAAILQASSYDSATVTVSHDMVAQSPANCSKGLGFPEDCTSSTGNVYTFGPNSQLARLVATDWYVGNNGRPEEGGRSLYRQRLDVASGLTTEEIVSGVTDMQIRYRLIGDDDLLDADAVDAADWDNVSAVAITLTIDSADDLITTESDVNNGRLQRRVTTLVTLRNRVQ